MTDFMKENEIRNLIKKANLYDELGNTDKANEIDNLIGSLIRGLEVKSEQSFLQLDVARIEEFLKSFNDKVLEMNQYGPGYIETLKRHLATPGIQAEDVQKIKALMNQLELSKNVKL